MIFAAMLLSTLTVLPSDRLAMADRQFNRGDYESASAEYEALVGEKDIPVDGLLYRRAECARARGQKDAARTLYAELLKTAPVSEFANRAQLQKSLLDPESERAVGLKRLDADSVETSVRVAALYHLGVQTSDAETLGRCIGLDPNGRYAVPARFRRANVLLESPDVAKRREGIGELVEIAFSKDPKFAEQALYLAAVKSYGEKRYGEASSLFRRYLKTYPEGPRAGEVRTMCAWSLYLEGRFADASAFCGNGGSDDTDYLIGACANALGKAGDAHRLLTAYLEAYPHGKYRESAELSLSRLDFAAAEKDGDSSRTLEAARRAAAITKSAADRLRLAWALERGGHESEALAEYVAVAKDFPNTAESADALLRKALVDIRARRWAPAELALAEALAGDKLTARRAEALYWRGIAAWSLGHEAEAVGFLVEADKAGLSLDQSREARILIADNDWKTGRVAAAKESFARLVREGAAERMGASKAVSVGRFLLDETGGGRRLDEARVCARAVVSAATTPEWRQAGRALEGQVEEAAGAFSAAIAAYRAAMAEKCRTEVMADVSGRLGALEVRAGNYIEAAVALEEAVQLNAHRPVSRREAYLGLARAALGAGDREKAKGYATVVTALFDDAGAKAEAERILAEASEEGAK